MRRGNEHPGPAHHDAGNMRQDHPRTARPSFTQTIPSRVTRTRTPARMITKPRDTRSDNRRTARVSVRVAQEDAYHTVHERRVPVGVVNPQQAACHEDKDGNYGVGDERQPQRHGHRETQYAGRLSRPFLHHGPRYESCNGFTARCGQETVDEHGHGDDDGQDAEAFRSKYPGGESQLG